MRGKALIVGGAGFIGWALLPRLAQLGIEGTVFDRRVAEACAFSTIKGDVRDLDALARAAHGHDILYNLAAEHRDDVRPKSLYYEVNVRGAENTCVAAERAGIRSIVFTSSVAVYGTSPRRLHEDDAHAPINDYGRTKSLAEKVYLDWAKAGADRKLVIVRPTVVFGPANRGNVYGLVSLVASGRFFMVGEGTNRKSMAYVENVADFLAHVVTLPHGIHVFNYADEPDLTMTELVALVCQTLGRSPEVPRVPSSVAVPVAAVADVVSSLLNVRLPISSIRLTKFRANTQIDAARAFASGFAPRVELKEGLRRMISAEFKGG
jgi:nucleoside-diphosphate-sugar epimerase